MISSIAIVDRNADEDAAPLWASTAPWELGEDGTADVPVSIVATGRSAARTHVELVATVLEEDLEVPMKTKVFWLSCGEVVVDGTIIDEGGDDDVTDDDGDAAVQGVVITGASAQPAATETATAPVTSGRPWLARATTLGDSPRWVGR